MLKANVWGVTVADWLIRILHPVAGVTEPMVFPSRRQRFNQQVGIAHNPSVSKISFIALSFALKGALGFQPAFLV
jgi:hypothetical protein